MEAAILFAGDVHAVVSKLRSFAVELQRQIDLLSRGQESEFDLLELRLVR
jgi:hypothetical protein